MYQYDRFYRIGREVDRCAGVESYEAREQSDFEGHVGRCTLKFCKLLIFNEVIGMRKGLNVIFMETGDNAPS